MTDIMRKRTVLSPGHGQGSRSQHQDQHSRVRRRRTLGSVQPHGGHPVGQRLWLSGEGRHFSRLGPVVPSNKWPTARLCAVLLPQKEAT